MTIPKTLDGAGGSRVALASAALAGWSLLMLSITACTTAAPAPTIEAQATTAAREPAAPATATGGEVQGEADTTAASSATGSAEDLNQRWGIEVTSLRLTASNHMIDFRYRVLDPVKAKELFVRQNKPALIHQETGKVLVVPETAKVGPLRNSDTPQAGKIYWMFFGNAGFLVKAGDKVTVVIGQFRAENLVVE